MIYLCDRMRHLICVPYSVDNLHRMAEHLNIKRCWFDRDHYDIPKCRIEEIQAKCEIVLPKVIAQIVRGDEENSLKAQDFFKSKIRIQEETIQTETGKED